MIKTLEKPVGNIIKPAKRKWTFRLFLIFVIAVAAYFFLPPLVVFTSGLYNRYHQRQLLAGKTSKQPTNYYINNSGNDVNDGKTPATAWKTIEKINQQELGPGDSVLFEGGQTYNGNLSLDENDLGTKNKPVYIGVRGTKKATINAGMGSAILVTNTQGLYFANFVLKGAGAAVNNGNGLGFINNMLGNVKLEYITVDSVEASGFRYNGILVEGKKNKSGFGHVSIRNCAVYDNGDAGLYVKGVFNMSSTAYAHNDITIQNVKAYNNAGLPESKINTGSGIVISDTEKGLIENCIAYNNGSKCTSNQGGPVGIWAWDAKEIIIQYNESYNNKTGCPYDGGGFDLDGGCVNSILQYNYSHDNDGSGFFLAQFYYARKHTGNIIRYNISENDGRKNGYAGIDVWGVVENALIYNNTVLINPAVTDTAKAILIRPNKEMGDGDQRFPKNVIIANNILLGSGPVNLVHALGEMTDLKLLNNNYFSTTNTAVFVWNKASYSSLEEWRTASLQEKQQEKFYGMAVNPQFVPGQNLLLEQGNQKQRFLLQQRSPLINKSINVEQGIKISPATVDIIGTKLPKGAANDLGAVESF